MAKQVINVGTAANDKKGDSLRAAFQKVNTNFTELYTALGINADVDLNLGAFEFTGSVMTTTDSSAIVIDQATTITSNLSVGGDLLPQTANGGDLGSSTLPWRSLYVSNNTIFIGGTAVGIDANGQLTVSGSQVNAPSSTLVNGAYTVSLGSNGNLNAPGIVSAAGLRTSETKIALGSNAGQTSQGSNSVAVGAFAGQTSQDPLSVAIGYGAGAATQGTSSVAVGNLAGSNTQGGLSVAVGSGAGQVNQGYEAVAVGFTTGLQDQGTWSVAIGSYAGAFSQGEDAIAIGRFAGQTDQPDNTIILNATGTEVNGVAAQTNSFYVAPIRNIGGTSGVLQYNAATKEVSYSSDITSEGNINIEINLADSTLRRWQFGEDGHLTLPAGGDIKDSTGTSVLGGGGSVSSLVNGAQTVSLSSSPVSGTTFSSGLTIHRLSGSMANITSDIDKVLQIATQTSNGRNEWSFGTNGTLTVPASGIITTADDEFFKLQAKDSDSVLRNEIKLDPNNGTYMSVWDTEQNPSYSASSWATASWQNNGGQGYVLITDAEDLADFWTAGAGSFVSGIEVSINGGARTSVTYQGDNEEQYDVELSVGAVPVSSPTTITSLTFYYRAKSIINIDYDGGEMLLNAQQMPIKLKTDNNINLESGQNLNIRGTGQYPVRIYANNNTRIWEFGTDGSLTLPLEGKIYGIGQGAAGDRYGYISWDGNSSGDGLGYNTMRLVPDLQGLEAADTYIILDPAYVDGETGSIHIRAGGTRDNSLANLCLGGANSHIKIGAGANPPVTVKANSNSWTFGTDGAITTSGAFKVNVPSGGIPTGVSNINSQGGYNIGSYTGLATSGGTGTGLTVNAASNAANGYLDTISINIAGTGYTAGDVITLVGGDGLGCTFTISASSTWTLGTTGRTIFPNGTVPEHSYGAAGDKEGMVVFDDTYIYYCTADYVDNVTDIWKRTAHSAGTW